MWPMGLELLSLSLRRGHSDKLGQEPINSEGRRRWALETGKTRVSRTKSKITPGKKASLGLDVNSRHVLGSPQLKLGATVSFSGRKRTTHLTCADDPVPRLSFCTVFRLQPRGNGWI